MRHSGANLGPTCTRAQSSLLTDEACDRVLLSYADRAHQSGFQRWSCLAAEQDRSARRGRGLEHGGGSARRMGLFVCFCPRRRDHTDGARAVGNQNTPIRERQVDFIRRGDAHAEFYSRGCQPSPCRSGGPRHARAEQTPA